MKWSFKCSHPATEWSLFLFTKISYGSIVLCIMNFLIKLGKETYNLLMELYDDQCLPHTHFQLVQNIWRVREQSVWAVAELTNINRFGQILYEKNVLKDCDKTSHSWEKGTLNEHLQWHPCRFIKIIQTFQMLNHVFF